MLLAELLGVERILSQNDNFVTGVKDKATGDSKLNVSSVV